MAELGRITSRDISELKLIWKEAIPKIFMVAKAAEKPGLTALLSHAEAESISDGKQAYVYTVKFV